MAAFDRFFKLTWCLAASAVFIYCLLSFFFWSLIDVLTPFAAPFLGLLALGLMVAAVVPAILLPIRRRRTHGMMVSLLPLGLLVVCFICTHTIDFSALWLTANFRFHHKNREEIIRRVANGELRPNVRHNAALIALPRQFAPVSLGGGEIVVEHDGNALRILFFTYRGVLDNFGGFVYTSDGSTPKNGDFSGDFFIARKIEDGWYYVSAH